MKEKYIFTIPVYVCSPDEYKIKREKYFQSQLERYTTEKNKETIELFQQAFNQFLWRPWKYNQIIGFIELFVWGKDIRGEYYFIDSQRISIHQKKKQYKYFGKAFEMGIYFEKDSETIFNTLIENLESLNNEKPFMNRYIDLQEFNEIGPFVNWKKLLGYN